MLWSQKTQLRNCFTLTPNSLTMVDKIKKEIERRIKELENDRYINIDAQVCRVSELQYLLRFIEKIS